MELIADILLVAGALGAGLYCFVLARRLKRFTDLEKGVGGAVSVLSAQADELKSSLESARVASDQSGQTLQQLTERAESVAQRLELMMASMHDVIPDEAEQQEPVAPQAEAKDLLPEFEEQVEIPEIEAPPAETEIEADPDPTKVTAAADPATETEPAEHAKAPEGIMFFRHARLQGGEAQ